MCLPSSLSSLLINSQSHIEAFALTFVDKTSQIKHSLLYTQKPCGITVKSLDTVYENLLQFVLSHPNKLTTPAGYFWHGSTFFFSADSGNGSSSSSSSSSNSASEDSSNSNSEPGSSILQSNTSPSRKTIFEPPLPPREDVEDPKKREDCIVCMAAAVDTVFLECGHVGCCQSCAVKCTTCPVCRRPITRVVPIHIV